MFIYNITIKVAWSIHERWLTWLKTERIPEMLQTKLFHQCQVLKLLELDEADGPTYAVQFHTQQAENYYTYMRELYNLHAAATSKKWGMDTVEFGTLMQIVNEQS